EPPMQPSRRRASPAACLHRATLLAMVPVAMVLLVAVPMSAELVAQEAPAWRVECTGDGKTLDCRAVQQLVQRESRQLVVSMLVRKGTDLKSAQVTMQLPIGINLTEPIQLKVDNGAVEKQPIQTCTNTG